MRVRFLTSLMTRGLGCVAVAGLVACGGGGGGGDDGPDAGGDPANDGSVGDADPGAPDAGGPGACEGPSTNSYLPFAVGNTWRYLVDEFDGSPPAVKAQSYTEMMTPDEETGPVIVQLTTNNKGSTESWFQQQGDRIVRLRQRDFNLAGNLERTTYYLPHRLRIDESPERLQTGVTWTENFVREEYDSLDRLVEQENQAEEWSVVNGDTACPEPWSEHRCVHLKRSTIEGGVSLKDYWFSRGIGKVREEGGVLEELVGCTLN